MDTSFVQESNSGTMAAILNQNFQKKFLYKDWLCYYRVSGITPCR
ncbi:MAG TPA: hypothetical protein PLZ53_11655 [Candidatus Hydrogenedentes bacterium]|jgi:hypothetical protein|nr:hypothetical protein [Candidatus Hydrogenedentota bacterium]HOD96105.1 hypothetical protein [Candidatus Hydrogenedentota bacterium]HOH43765.1 hypothetical protein [Candidatus Hydrogenedentota bacterium]HOM47766.1 hypothetical protein [Candidatus Hydrogenedentota bacterium]HOR50929.1 hypothetical protein [Candidatus Hydrogenedentota bacterium]